MEIMGEKYVKNRKILYVGSFVTYYLATASIPYISRFISPKIPALLVDPISVAIAWGLGLTILPLGFYYFTRGTT